MVKNNPSSSLKQTEDKKIKEEVKKEILEQLNQIILDIDKVIYNINLRFQIRRGNKLKWVDLQ